MLVAPKRHVADWFDATADEQREIWLAVDAIRRRVDAERAPLGYEISFDLDPAGRATSRHLHVHVVPTYAVTAEQAFGLQAPHAQPLVTGSSEDPLLPHLLSSLVGALSFRASVAFLLPRGAALLRPRLDDLLLRGGRVQMLVGDYLDVTDPDALVALLDLKQGFPERVQLRVYEAKERGFHPKSYLAESENGLGVAFVGSSNLSESALSRAVEWNYRIVASDDPVAFAFIRSELDRLFQDPATVEMTRGWIDAYRARRRVPYRVAPSASGFSAVAEAAADIEAAEVESELPIPFPKPTPIQAEALEALEGTRADGNRAGLVVLATGLGKTWLAAFDACRPTIKRVLFIAHVDEILRQAFATFRRLRPNARFGYFRGDAKDVEADFVFASIQALSRPANLKRFARDAFDYIVVDEFHHADAESYRRVLHYFTTGFLLGLTATPERTDGGNLLALCEENLVFRADLMEGIERGLLAPFDYFGVPDVVDYENVPWRSGRFAELELEAALAVNERAANALEQLQKRGGQRVLAFCASIRHADFTRAYFEAHGVSALSVHSGPSGANREDAIRALTQGHVRVLVTVDMFSEGVDIPEVDTVLMLRPTESKILWLQQIGRGLRLSRAKDRLQIIDYVGNHRTFLRGVEALFGIDSPAGLAALVARIEAANGSIALPGGCHVQYDLESVDILRALVTRATKLPTFDAWVVDFLEANSRRPTAVEAFHADLPPDALPKKLGSWFDALREVERRRSVDVLVPDERTALQSTAAWSFLRDLQSLPATMHTLLAIEAWLDAAWPDPIPAKAIVEFIQKKAHTVDPVALDLDVDVHDELAILRVLQDKVVPGIVAHSSRDAALRWERDQLGFAEPLDPAIRSTTRDLAIEIVAWRFAAMLGRRRSDRFTQIRDDGGVAIDARFTIERSTGGYSVFVESRGGTLGTEEARNSKYSDGLALLLRRLARMRGVVTTIELATKQVTGQQLPMAKYPYPIELSAVADVDAVRRAIQSAQGNNSTRRIRLQVTGIADASLARVHRRLALA